MSGETTRVDVASDLEVLLTRTFVAPRELVWEAMSRPEYVRQWYGLGILELVLCEIDHRVGGSWRFVLRAPDGCEHAYSGVYRDIIRPERVVHTENYEPLGPGHEIEVTSTLVERDRRTTLTARLLYPSKADRDGHLQAGMERGVRESHDRLAEVVEGLAQGARA